MTAVTALKTNTCPPLSLPRNPFAPERASRACVHTQVCVHVRVYMVCTQMCIHAHVYLYVMCGCACMCVYTCRYVRMRVSVCTHDCVHVCMMCTQ